MSSQCLLRTAVASLLTFLTRTSSLKTSAGDDSIPTQSQIFNFKCTLIPNITIVLVLTVTVKEDVNFVL